MTRALEDLAGDALKKARAAGADAADTVVIQSSDISVDMRQGGLEKAERSEELAIGLRVFVGARQACISVSDTSPDALTAMAERAVAMAREAPEDHHAGLGAPSELAEARDAASLDLADPAEEPSPATLEADAARVEEAALAQTGVTQVEGATAGYSESKVHLSATNGFSGTYRRTSRWRACSAIAGEGLGMERDYDSDRRVYQSDLRDAEDIGRVAGQRAAERVGSRKPPTGVFPILFDERIAGSLIGHLLAAVNGNAIARGSSWLLEAQGHPVLPEGLNLVEDPHRPRVTGSRLFDGEGLPTRKRHIVENGKLTGWTLDLATARRLNLTSTGNAARGVSQPPSPMNWNVALTQGALSKADLIRDMGTGLVVTSMIGATINPNTGDYSRGASGFWVENGAISYPVNECTIAGNLREMLQRIVPANDARLWLSRVVPSLLVEGMTLAGE